MLFAAGHTWGFRQGDPKWGAGSLISSMQSFHFKATGFDRTYWDFFVGFGFFVTVLMVFAAIVAWQLGGLAPGPLAGMRLSAWGFVVCFAGVAYLLLRHPYRFFDRHPALPSSGRLDLRQIQPKGINLNAATPL